MDINQTSSVSDEAKWLHLLNADQSPMYSNGNEELPVKLKLKSTDSKEWEDEQRIQVRELQKKNRRFNGKYTPSLDEIKANNRRLYSAIVVGFENLTAAGQTPSRDDVIEMFSRSPDILEQVQMFVDDRANFANSVLTG